MPNPSKSVQEIDELTDFIRQFLNFKTSKINLNIESELKTLIDKHQSFLDTHDKQGQTPLTLIMEMDSKSKIHHRDFMDVSFLLLEKGANPHIKNAEGKHILSCSWNKNRKYYSLIEKFLSKGYDLGDFDLDVGDGITGLIENTFYSEVSRLENKSFSLEDISPESNQKINFYLDYLVDKKAKTGKIESNPFCIFSRFSDFTSQKERDFLENHLGSIQSWFKICQEKGFDINQKDQDGMGIIHYGVKIQSFALLNILSDFNADLFPSPFLGKSIEDYASDYNIPDYEIWATMKTQQRLLKNIPLSNQFPKNRKI